MGIILDGKKLADEILDDLKLEIKQNNYTPSIAVVIVGNNSASKLYVHNKHKKALELGMTSRIIELPDDISQENLEKQIDALAQDAEINAILIQLPLPKHINVAKVIDKIPPHKDVDGFNPYNVGRSLIGLEPYAKSCTPLGIIKLLAKYNISLEGKNVVIVGRSNIVGKPLAAMLINESATVTICNSKTKELNKITTKADILISAIGKPKFFTTDFIKRDAVVIDVGINHDENNKLVGDVDFENVKNIASYITPVPKGVGPMTIAMLMFNTLSLYKKNL